MRKISLGADERGVSPVIGVILMVAITVLLAATAASFFLGFQDSSTTVTPNMAFGFDYEVDTSPGGSDSLGIALQSGDSVRAKTLSVVVSGASATAGSPNGRYAFEDLSGAIDGESQVMAGESMTLDAASLGGGVSGLDLSEATVKVVWTAGSGDSGSVMSEWSKD